MSRGFISSRHPAAFCSPLVAPHSAKSSSCLFASLLSPVFIFHTVPSLLVFCLISSIFLAFPSFHRCPVTASYVSFLSPSISVPWPTHTSVVFFSSPITFFFTLFLILLFSCHHLLSAIICTELSVPTVNDRYWLDKVSHCDRCISNCSFSEISWLTSLTCRLCCKAELGETFHIGMLHAQRHCTDVKLLCFIEHYALKTCLWRCNSTQS